MRYFGAMVLGLVGFLVIGPESSMAYTCGSSPPEDMEKLRKLVDPKGNFGESEASLAALGAVYQFKMKRGDTAGAACTAFQIIQYHRQAQQRYAILASCAVQKGDLDTACRAAMKSYANVPDKDVKFSKTPDGQVSYTYTDSKTGVLMSQGIEKPDKLASAAMGFAEEGFDKALLATAEPEILRRSVQGADAPATLSRQPMNCVTMKLDSGISTTNCN
jgi:hypothetical protein